MRNIYFLILFFCPLFCITQIANAQTGETLSSPPKIVSSINPIYQIAKFISGDEKNNSLLIQPYALEYQYYIKPSDIEKLNKADLVLFVSSDLELNLAANISKVNQKTKIVELIKLKNIKTISYQARRDETVTDPNIWLSPSNAIAIASEIANILAKLYPPESATYYKNLAQFSSDIKNMDDVNKGNLSKIPPKSFIVDLDRLAYFEDYYGLKSAAILRYDYDDEPKVSHVAKINNVIKKEKSVCILESLQVRAGFARQIATSNKIKVTTIDVIGKASYANTNYSSPNGYVNMMQDLMSNIVKCVNSDSEKY